MRVANVGFEREEYEVFVSSAPVKVVRTTGFRTDGRALRRCVRQCGVQGKANN